MKNLPSKAGNMDLIFGQGTYFSLSCTGEGNGNPLQYSCLENLRDGGAWLLSMGSHRVGHDWSDLAAAAAVKAMVFPVVMYGCESWILKKAESRRIDAFELWCWRRLLRAPWTARRSNQSLLKETSPECSLEGMICSSHVKRWLIGKDLDAGRDWGQEEKGMTEDEMAGWHH